MKIKILNKNLNHPEASTLDYSDIKEYEVDDGAVFTETYNETLDTGTITISNLSAPIEIEPYDIVAIYKTGSNTIWKYMCVDTYSEQMLSINPRLYRYEIILFSETKQLEGTVLPNLKITKVWGQTRSLYYYINQYMTEYCPKVRAVSYIRNYSLNTVDDEFVSHSDDNYYYTVTLSSSSIVTSIPLADDIKVSATVKVTITQGGLEQTVTDDNCQIIYSRLGVGYWELQFKMDLGPFDSVYSVTLVDYKIYERAYEFVPKFNWIYDDDSNSYPDLEDKFSDECPEMQWNTPTLREVLNDLMMIKDCIPVIKNGRLEFVNLTITKTPTENTLSKINYVTKSKSSEDYVSELQVKLENVTDKTNNYVTKKEYIAFNIPNQNATMTSNNILLRTQYPIYKIKSLKMMVATTAEGNPTGTLPAQVRKWDQIDLTNLFWNNTRFNLVYEYEEWITKKVSYITDAPSNFEDYINYQNWTLYYTRGTNEIRNFESSQKFIWLTVFLRENLIYMNGVINEPSGYTNYTVSLNNSTYYLNFFEIEYETLEGCLFRASKGTGVEHEKVVIDNQTNSYVDSYSQGFLEYQKANRLGNEQLQINARYLPSETTLEISDVYEDSIVYQCQYQFYRDHTEVNAQATKNYVLREYFTGVKSKIRSWRLADGSQALTRHDLIKYYCEFSYNKHNEINGLNDLSQYNVAQYFVSSLEDYYVEPLKCCFVRTIDNNDTPHPNNYIMVQDTMKSYYCLDLMSRIIGNSLVFTFEFLDNIWAGQSVHTENDFNTYNTGTYPSRPSEDVYLLYSDLYYDTTYYKITISDNALKNGGLPIVQHRYTDDNGELISGEVVLTSKIKNIPTMWVRNLPSLQIVEDYYDDVVPGTNWQDSDNLNVIKTQSKKFMFYTYQRPRAYESSFRWNGDTKYDYSEIAFNFSFKKDSQEIMNLSTQFEFLSETQDIVFSKYWLNFQKAVNTSGQGIIYMRLFSKDKYDYRNVNELPSGNSTSVAIDINFNKTSNLSNEVIISLEDGHTYNSNAEAKAAAENYSQNFCFYICDFLEKELPLLALNNIPAENCIGRNNKPSFKINLNILKSRNKNIYDANNHYVIKGKI